MRLTDKIKITLYKIWYKYNHSFITAILLVIPCLFGYGLEVLLIIGGFWFGREHSQAEYRFMNIHNINRDELGFFDGFKPICWNFDSLFNDLILPIFIGINIVLIFNNLI